MNLSGKFFRRITGSILKGKKAIWIPLRCVALAALALGGGMTETVQAQVSAVRANDFLDSIGIDTKISQGIDSPTSVVSSLTYSGIRHIRDDGKNISGLVTVHNGTGAKVCLLPANGNVTTTISRLNQVAAAGALLAAEGPNEPNNWPVTYLGQTSSSTTSLPIAWFCRDLYSAVKADPNLASYPVFASSEAGGSEPDNCGLQFLTIPSGAGTLMPDGTVYADYANTHNYVCAHFSAVVDNNAWSSMDPTLNSSWDGLYVEYGHTWWSPGYNGYTNAQLLTLPRVCTETGWETQGTNSISQDQQGRVFLNLYLAAYKRGWKHTFIYQLKDFAPYDEFFGLFNQDYTPKLAATYLHNMTAVLADTATSFTPGTLAYSIPSQPATVHDLLLQKGSGQFELAVWSEKASGTNSITVNLGTTFSTVNVYDPTVGTSPVQVLSNASSVPLTLSDHPVILEPIGAASGSGAIVSTTFSPGASRQALNGTQIGLTTNLPGGSWIWGGGWNWGAPYVKATWDSAPLDVATLAEEKTALAVSLASSGSYVKPAKFRIAAEIGVTGTNGGGLGFWSVMPARSDSVSAQTGFTGLNLKANGNLQLHVNGAAVGSPAATFAIVSGTLYPLSYEVNTATGAISNVRFNGSPVTGLASTGFTNAATAYGGTMSMSGARTSMRNFQVTPAGTPAFDILVTGFVSDASRQSLDGTATGLGTNLPGGNWIWGAGWNWGAPFVHATWDPAPYNCADLAEEKTVLAHGLASSGSYVKPAKIRISAELSVTGTYGGGLGYWSNIPARADGGNSTTSFTGLNLKGDGSLQLYVNGTAVGSPVATIPLVSGTFYALSYDVDTATGALSNVIFNGSAVSGFSTTGFTASATSFAGGMSGVGGRTKMRNFKVSSW